MVVGDVIGKGTEEHNSAVGETPNLAARLQALAPPNGVVIASSTQTLLGVKFDYEDLGSHCPQGGVCTGPGLARGSAFRVESRFAATVDTKLTPLVNREEEIALLLMRWQQAKQCDGQ